jgi:hypothetical protein
MGWQSNLDHPDICPTDCRIQVVATFPEKSQHKSYTVLSGIEHYIFYSVKFTNRLSGKLPTIFVHLSSGKLILTLMSYLDRLPLQ